MKITLLVLLTTLPLLAQEPSPAPDGGAPPTPPPAAEHPGHHHAHGPHDRAAFMEKFDTNKDGKIDEQEKEAIKAAREARKAEFEKRMLEKFDANKDGQLDDQEKAAMKEEFARMHGQGPRGRRHCGHGPAMPPGKPGCGPRPGEHGGCCPPPPPCCPCCTPHHQPQGCPEPAAPEAPAPEQPAPTPQEES